MSVERTLGLPEAVDEVLRILALQCNQLCYSL